ncbi:MAG: hypothetical protein IKY72_08310 [Bacteroidaceae bacterium]|nr:hypothetical protein [Bacteroidaceae bacterium]
MNTINNKFSFARFAAVLKCDLMENWVRYVGVFAILFFANLAYQLTDIKDVVELSTLRALPVEEYMRQLAIDCVPLFYGVLSLSLMCAAADMTTVPFRTKGHATNYLMMPATNMEKFLSRVFINVVMVIVMAYVALFLADLARMLYVAISDIEGFYGFTVPTVWNELFEPLREAYKNGGVGYVIVDNEIVRPEWEMSMAIMAVATLVLSMFYVHSIIFLGGCIWRKGALLKTIFMVFMIAFLIIWVIAQIIPSEEWIEIVFYPWVESVAESEKEFMRFVFLITNVVFATFTILHWWLSYRLFSRKQMIPRMHLFGSNHPHHFFKKAHS